jgi:hypothetical protein
MNHISGRLGESHLHNNSSVFGLLSKNNLYNENWTGCILPVVHGANFYKHCLVKSLLFGVVADSNNNNNNMYVTVIIRYFSPDTPSSQISHSLLPLLLLIRLSVIQIFNLIVLHRCMFQCVHDHSSFHERLIAEKACIRRGFRYVPFVS